MTPGQIQVHGFILSCLGKLQDIAVDADLVIAEEIQSVIDDAVLPEVEARVAA